MFIDNIKKDVEFLFEQLSSIRTSNTDFKPYRNTVDSLIKTFDSLNKLYNYNLSNEDTEYYNSFLSKLKNEAEELQNLKEIYKNNNSQFRCLNDAYLKLIEKIYQLEKYKIDKILKNIKSIK